jgi:hypothetical protein
VSASTVRDPVERYSGRHSECEHSERPSGRDTVRDGELALAEPRIWHCRREIDMSVSQALIQRGLWGALEAARSRYWLGGVRYQEKLPIWAATLPGERVVQ